ncbi:MAG: FHA domain-containing protein, partial [Deltaproteobacteria bacterium]
TQGGRTCEISGTLDGQPLVFLHRGLPLSSGASLTLSQGEEIVSCWVRGGIVDIVVSDGETRIEQTYVVNLLGRESRGEESLSFALPPAAGGTGKSTGTPLSLPEAACACARPLIDLPGDSLMPEIATIYGALFLALHAPEAGEREEARKRFEAAWSSILSHRDEAAGFRWRTPAEIPPGGERTVAASLLMLAPLREILPLDATLAERSKDLEEMGRIVGKASGLLPLPDLPESVAEAFLLLSTTGEEETRQGTVRWLRDRLATPDPAMTRRERILTAAALFWLDAQFEEVSPATEESAEHGEIPPPMAAEGEAKSAEEEGVVRELEELLTEHLAEENEVLERIFTEHFGPAPQEPISQEAPPELEGEEAEEAPGPSDEALRRYRVGEGYRLALELADTARLSPTDPPVQGIAATLLFAALLRLPESLYPRITRRKERVEVDLTQWRDRIPITCLFQRAERQIDRIYRGDTVDLAIRCDTGWRAGDEVTIWLPQAFSFLHADPSVKRRTFPWRSGEFLTIPLVATGETRGLAGTPAPQHWGLMLSNLFDEQRVTFLDDLEIVIEPGLPPDEELTRFTTLGPEMLAPEGEESGTAAETEEEEPGTILALKETQVAESSDTAPSSDANEMTVIALKGDLEVSPEDYEPIPRPKLLHQEEATRIAHEADAEGIPFLLVQEGIYAGMRFPLDSEKTTIGKGLGNDIHLLDETVNQIHAVIDRDGDTWTIKDLQSHHGTFVNGVRIKKRVLEHHDEIAMGNTKFRFVVPGAQERKEVPRREAASPPEPFSPEERTTTSGRYEEITMPFPGGRREPPPRPDAPPPQMTGDEVNPFLVVLRGRGTQPRYEVVPPLVTIGRSVTNDIQIPDSEMSRKHAEIVFRDGRFILRDLLSTMGTYVNRKLIQGEVVLHDGDEIAMGGTLLQFVMPRPRETEAPPAVGDEVHPQLPYEQTRLHTSASAWDVDDQTRVQRVMTLMIEEGPNAGEKFVISAQRTTIGRSIANDIQIIDQEVSRKHAEILRRDGTFILRDLESTTGTFVNGEPIEEIELQNEDEILIGNTLLVVMFL